MKRKNKHTPVYATFLCGLPLLASQLAAQTNQITSPANGAEFLASESFNVEADVSDPDGINSVRLWQEDGSSATVVSVLNAAPFTWSISGLSEGQHEFYTRSKDNLNNLDDSERITVNIVDSYSRIVSPANGAVVDVSQSVTITAEAGDTDGVDSIRLWKFDGTTHEYVDVRTAPPYEWVVNSTTAGEFQYYVRAKDSLGNNLDSEYITVHFTEPYNRIITPDEGATFSDVESFTVTAEVEDVDGINSVRLWMDDGTTTEVVGILNEAPFSWEISGLTAGQYTFFTRSKDNLNNLLDSDSVVVEITTDDGTGNGTFPVVGSTIALTAVNGMYVSAANPNQELIANRTAIGSFEIFEVVAADEGYVAFKCLGNDKYVVADNAGSATLKANRNAVGGWEQFQFAERENDLGLIAKANGKYVTAESGGNAPLIADRDAQGGWESFVYAEVEYTEPTPDPDPDPDPDPEPDPDPTPDPDPGNPTDPSDVLDLPINQSNLEVGPMVGHTTHNSAILWVYPKNTSNVKAYYVKRSDPSVAYSKQMAKQESDDNSYRTTVTGLSAKTIYDYYIVSNDNAIIGLGSFETAPAPSSNGHQFTFAFTSCGKVADDDQQVGWTYMQDHDPDFVMYLGDTMYTSGYTKDMYRVSNRNQKQVPTFADIISKYPMYTCWDDHDYGGNNTNKDSSRGGVPGNVLRDIALDAFKDAWANPYAGGPSNGTYYDFTWGDVHFIVLDNRYHKTSHRGRDDSKMFGDEQMAWLKDKLENSTATFKLICMGGSYNGTDSEGFEAYPTEFQGLRGHIIDKQINGVVFLSGDVHTNQVRFADTGNKNLGGYHAYNLIASGIGRSNKRSKWAKIDIDTTLSDPTLKITFYWKGDNVISWGPTDPKYFIPEVYDYTLKLSDLSH